MTTRKFTFDSLARYLIAFAISFMVLIPLAMTVFGALKTTGDLLANPIGWPDQLHWENFEGILQSKTFWQQLRNSLFVMLVTSLGSVLLSSMPAFIFARINFWGR